MGSTAPASPRNFQRETRLGGQRQPLGIKPKPPTKWSHQRELEDARGKAIRFRVKMDDTWFRGTLLEADQFTIKIEIEGLCVETATTECVTFQKNELACWILT